MGDMSGDDQTTLEVKMLDVEVLGWLLLFPCPHGLSYINHNIESEEFYIE